MDQKQIKRNLNYFTKSDTPMYVGIGMLIVGVVLYFVTYSYLVYIIASVLAAAGLILALIGASHRVTDTDIDSCVARLTEGMEVDLVENPKFAKRMLKQVPVIKLQNYIYDDIIPGVQLIVTAETNQQPLSPAIIDKTILKYFI